MQVNQAQINKNLHRGIDAAALTFFTGITFMAIGTKGGTSVYDVPSFGTVVIIAFLCKDIAKKMVVRLESEFHQTWMGQVTGFYLGTTGAFLASKAMSFAASYFSNEK